MNDEKVNGENSTAKVPFSYLKFFFSCVYISTFTFGGGFVMLPLMKRRFSEELHWIDEDEMINYMSLAQASPGAIAVNTTVIVGYQLGRIPGAVLALIGTALPPFVIIIIFTAFYNVLQFNPYVSAFLQGMGACIGALITDALISLGMGVIKQRNIISYIVMAAAFTANFVFDVKVIYILLAAALIGGITAFVNWKRKGKE